MLKFHSEWIVRKKDLLMANRVWYLFSYVRSNYPTAGLEICVIPKHKTICFSLWGATQELNFLKYFMEINY